MPIDDIIREKNGGAVNQQQQTRQQTQQQTQQSRGTLQIEVPDPMQGDAEAMLFWLNVVQTVILVALLFRS